MITTRDDAAAKRRRLGVGVLLGVEAVALGIASATHDPAFHPVTATLGFGARQTLSRVDVGIALVVVVALVALARLVGPPVEQWLDPLLTTPIVVFVIAQLNGVQDLGALVGIYALASAGVLFALLQSRVDVRGRHPRLSLGFGAAVGIVPWGIVAFQQVGAALVGRPLSGAVVLITLVALLFAMAEFVAAWRGRRAAAVGLRVVGLSVVAWLVVLLP